ncbi:LSU ribosomal protein L3P [Thalassoporum mexicanum PCC 7367]|uniref:50S ribosomal protein L3 n=1 Tax=Thalassoporum mexicanum TaxID=3457544 RepID=UPI00029FD091|nr:50S ribosomal protein L3 [Pseudanabaena sp. PCC 7367]AFY69376.1 LSU ribosomal protein L3P [Pseudanabaena sp. PCC 7367]
MSVGILGTKLGITQVFDDEGNVVPVTVVQAGPCKITQIKTEVKEGYNAIQVGFGNTREKLLTKPELGHLAKSQTSPVKHLHEYRVDDTGTYDLGQEIDVSIFNDGDLIDVSGVSVGKGFSGYQKRHNFRRGPMSHGSKNHRQPGSTGAGTTPGRVYPGKKMAGRLGGVKVTIRKLTVFQVDSEKNILLVRGSVPGKPGALLNITPANIVGGKK